MCEVLKYYAVQKCADTYVDFEKHFFTLRKVRPIVVVLTTELLRLAITTLNE